MGDEKWKDVDGFENLYQISNCGNVKSLERHNYRYHQIKEKILKPSKNKKGYLTVTLWKNKKSYTKIIHILVAQAFIPNPNNLPQVNHINGIKQDNRPENLEWCTNEYNQKHAQENGLNSTKRVLLKNEKEEHIFNSINEAYRFLNRTPSGHYKKYINTDQEHLNFTWKYL